jgi:hypothetical protein
MSLVAGVIKIISMLASLGLFVHFVFIEWSMIRDEWIQILNPFLHIRVLVAMLLMVEFWVLALLAIGGGFLADRLDPGSGVNPSVPDAVTGRSDHSST